MIGILPRVGVQLSYRLQLLTSILAIQTQIPELETHLVREINVDGTCPSSGGDQWRCGPRGPRKGGRPWDLPQTDHDGGEMYM